METIYKIADENETMVYFGSTERRTKFVFKTYRMKYRRYLKGKEKKMCVFKIFKELGMENLKLTNLEVIEKEKSHDRLRVYIRECENSINKMFSEK